MKVLNIHKRTFNQPKEKLGELLEALSTKNDKIWPYEKWPAMRFKKGLKEGSKGGHGPIRYTIEKFVPNEHIQFKFYKPNGFNGVHRFEISELGNNKTELKHTIKMDVVGFGIFNWIIAIKPLHNALLDDALNKVENHFLSNSPKTEWNIWVKILRKLLK
jgi:hypothetical protein